MQRRFNSILRRMSSMVLMVALDNAFGMMSGTASSTSLSSVIEYMSPLPVDESETIEDTRSFGRSWDGRLSLIHCSTSSLWGVDSETGPLKALVQSGLSSFEGLLSGSGLLVMLFLWRCNALGGASLCIFNHTEGPQSGRLVLLAPNAEGSKVNAGSPAEGTFASAGPNWTVRRQ